MRPSSRRRPGSVKPMRCARPIVGRMPACAGMTACGDTRDFAQVSSSALCRGSISQNSPEPAARWIPGTSPRMTWVGRARGRGLQPSAARPNPTYGSSLCESVCKGHTLQPAKNVIPASRSDRAQHDRPGSMATRSLRRASMWHRLRGSQTPRALKLVVYAGMTMRQRDSTCRLG